LGRLPHTHTLARGWTPFAPRACPCYRLYLHCGCIFYCTHTFPTSRLVRVLRFDVLTPAFAPPVTFGRCWFATSIAFYEFRHLLRVCVAMVRFRYTGCGIYHIPLHRTQPPLPPRSRHNAGWLLDTRVYTFRFARLVASTPFPTTHTRLPHVFAFTFYRLQHRGLPFGSRGSPTTSVRFPLPF